MIDRTAPRPRAALVLLLAVLSLLAGCGAGTPPAAPAPPVAAPATAPLTPADAAAWLDGLVPAALDRSGIAGAAVVVVRDGEVVTARGYGVSDTATARPVDVDDTLFRVGSVSKVFTATAVLQLVEQGRIDLDADVRRYLDFPLPLRFDPPVTMRHLLTHTAGFEERLHGLLPLGEGSEDCAPRWPSTRRSRSSPPGPRLPTRTTATVSPGTSCGGSAACPSTSTCSAPCWTGPGWRRRRSRSRCRGLCTTGCRRPTARAPTRRPRSRRSGPHRPAHWRPPSRTWAAS